MGGLIQAYTEATKSALAHVTFIQKELTKKLTLHYGYDQLSLVQYYYSKYEVQILSEKFDSEIDQEVAVNIAFYETMKKELKEKQVSCQ